jgi:hypothetical protein
LGFIPTKGVGSSQGLRIGVVKKWNKRVQGNAR